jgi:hypothetical protein
VLRLFFNVRVYSNCFHISTVVSVSYFFIFVSVASLK